jgi:lipopolysaccharide export system permease protein
MSSAALVHPPPRHRRPGLTLYLYIAREALRPAAFALLGLTAVLLTTNLLGFSDLMVNRGVGAGDVAWMLFCDAVPVAGRMFPFAVLIGALVALGRMGADREILLLEASGVAAPRLVWPIVSLAGALMLPALLLSAYGVPWAGRQFDAALAEVSRAKPWARLQAGTVNEFGGWRLEAREVSPSGEDLRGVLLWAPEVGETLFARSGRLSASESGAIQITLHEASLLLPVRDERTRWLRFETATTFLPESDAALARDERDRIPTLPLGELFDRARQFEPTPDNPTPLAELALHGRFAYPVATLVFGFLAVPLFVARGSYSRSAGGLIGLSCVIAYYALLQLGEGLVQAGTLPVALGAWLPNLALTLLAVVLLVRALRERVVGHSFAPRRLRRFIPHAVGGGEPGRARPHRYALPRYVGRTFLRLLGLAFAVLFVAYFLIDAMDRLSWFTRNQATAVEVLRFYGARVWLLASRAVPMAILVAAALTVSLLAVEGELMGMRACGIPAPRAMLPVLGLAVAIAPLYFLLNNVVVPRTNALADELKRTEIKDLRGGAAQPEVGTWYRSGQQVLEAELFDPELGQARHLTIFELGEDGLPVARTDAASGRHIGQGWWRLSQPTRVEIHDGALSRVDAPRHAQLGLTIQAEVDTMHLPVHANAAEARALEADGFDARPFWADYHARLAEPLACIVLPALVIFFAVGGPPFPGPAQSLLVSGLLGVSYILLVALATSLGRGGAVPPVVGAWGPLAAFTGLGGWLGLRLWRGM